jgi:tetratricopeptide (TPR) repeat protein
MGAGYTKSKVKTMGNEHFKEGRYYQAAKFYTYALKHDKANYSLYSNRCLCYLKLGKVGYAYEDAIMTIKLAPKFAKGYFRLATV